MPCVNKFTEFFSCRTDVEVGPGVLHCTLTTGRVRKDIVPDSYFVNVITPSSSDDSTDEAGLTVLERHSMAQSKSSASSALTGVGGRVAVVDALRTPFARIATHFREHNVVDLGAMAVAELAARNNLSATDIDQIIFGQTIMASGTQFIGREVALACGMPDVDAYSVTRACATSFQPTSSWPAAPIPPRMRRFRSPRNWPRRSGTPISPRP